MFGRQYQQHPPNNFLPFKEDTYSSYSMNSYYQNQMPLPPYTEDHYYTSLNDYTPQHVNAHHPNNQTSPAYYLNNPNAYMDVYGFGNQNNFAPYQQPAAPKINKQPTNQAGFLSQFQAASGQIDVNKMLATVGQLANTVQQVTPMLKQLSNFIKKA